MTVLGALLTSGWLLSECESALLSLGGLMLLLQHFGIADHTGARGLREAHEGAWILPTLATVIVGEWWLLHAVLGASIPWAAGIAFAAVLIALHRLEISAEILRASGQASARESAAVRAPPLQHPALLRMKRHFDLALTLPAVIPITLLIGALALLVRLQDGGPAFIKQVRTGHRGRRFLCWKLRSMRVDAEQPGQPRWSEQADSRITPLGSFLRRSWLDELPQLWLVLSGELSLVGPRPERPVFVQAFTRPLPKYPQRHAVPAGLTGLAQVRGFTGASSVAGRLTNDLQYVREWTPAFDLRLILRTLQQMVAPASRPDPHGKAPLLSPEEKQPSPPTPPSTST